MAMAVATPGIRALGDRPRRRADRGGPAAVAAIGLATSSCARATSPTCRRAARRVRLHRRPRRLRRGSRSRCATTCWRDPRHLAADGLAYVSYNASPAATCAGCCARRGCGTRATPAAPLEQAEQAQALYRFLARTARGTDDWWGGLLESELPRSRRARSTGSCTTTSPSTGAPSGSRSSPSARPATGSPTWATRPRATCCRPRARPVAADVRELRRRPDRDRS